jgi:hypothetical protein
VPLQRYPTDALVAHVWVAAIASGIESCSHPGLTDHQNMLEMDGMSVRRGVTEGPTARLGRA